ncbi:hypothetical protein ACFLFF_10265 [Brevibacillus reuszeri]|uniref:hypothetical protein n=1 Tax=Brevibacillus reuszeri TaxID=54915 RepID=UPI00366C162E
MRHTWGKGKMAWLAGTGTFFTALLLLSGCTTVDSATTSGYKNTNETASWPYRYVKIENRVYIIQNSDEDKVAKQLIGEQIGAVEKKYEFEGEEGAVSGTVIVSNYLGEGTKLYAIKGVDQSNAIAIEEEEDEFFQATAEGLIQKEKTNDEESSDRKKQ